MFTTYIIGCLALIIKPGPDLMCTLATALSCGKVRASTLMAGLILGCWLWVLLLTAGVAYSASDSPDKTGFFARYNPRNVSSECWG